MNDLAIRRFAFDWLAEQITLFGDVLPRAILAQGFLYEAMRVPLLGPQGIFKPRLLDLPLSITTSPEGPYDDAFGTDQLLRYRYRGTERNHRDNVGLRTSMERRVPLVYFHGLLPGRYLASWPVFIVGDNPESLTFTVALDDVLYSGLEAHRGAVLPIEEEGAVRRRYITAALRVRLHQRSFRERVLHAYRERCAMCRLRHQELLDAAHIIPDSEPEGEPVVQNGLALCKLHHAAFDRQFLGVRPDYVIEVRREILDENDGPMLLHGLKGLHQQQILVPQTPRLRPNRELLARRYASFLGRN